MKKIIYVILSCFIIISCDFFNENSYEKQCKFEIERAEQLKENFGHIETALDINEIYSELADGSRAIHCSSSNDEHVKKITEIMRKKNNSALNSPLLLERQALKEIEEFKKAHKEQMKDFDFPDNALVKENNIAYERLGEMIHIIYYDYIDKDKNFLWERNKNRIITEYFKWSGNSFENWDKLFSEYREFSLKETSENKKEFCRLIKTKTPEQFQAKTEAENFFRYTFKFKRDKIFNWYSEEYFSNPVPVICSK